MQQVNLKNTTEWKKWKLQNIICNILSYQDYKQVKLGNFCLDIYMDIVTLCTRMEVNDHYKEHCLVQMTFTFGR